jgi:ubiquinone/menaquinone biosynthesis C-methylase UbiE
MIEALRIDDHDDVVEFAPGLGATASSVLNRHPRSFTAIERDEQAAAIVRRYLHGPNQKCLRGHAGETGLPNECATVVYGEAMLSMQTDTQKAKIIAEAYRVLRDGGRYAMHELCLTSDELPPDERAAIMSDLSQAIHVGVRPLTTSEWRQLLERSGFCVDTEIVAAMHLLEPRRMIADEGVANTLRIVWRAVRDRPARRRMLEMRAVFRKHAARLSAVALIAHKPVKSHENQ